MKEQFKKLQNKYPALSDYITLATVVLNNKYSNRQIVQAFSDLVNKEEYPRGERDNLLSHLLQISGKKFQI